MADVLAEDILQRSSKELRWQTFWQRSSRGYSFFGRGYSTKVFQRIEMADVLAEDILQRSSKELRWQTFWQRGYSTKVFQRLTFSLC
ncbi:hypothetical protein TNCV_754791 [Trichonephila clavipes]|nr:hypothetical protein TNCV_754791 [Trichonephila clavipes]